MHYLVSLPRRVVTVWIPLIVFLIVLLFPFYWMLITAFKPDDELLSRTGNPFWVHVPTLAHIKKLLFDTAYPDWLQKIDRTVATTETSIVFQSQSGYAVSNSSFLTCASVGFVHPERIALARQQLLVRLERRDDHPVEREQQHDQERRQRDVDGDDAPRQRHEVVHPLRVGDLGASAATVVLICRSRPAATRGAAARSTTP